MSAANDASMDLIVKKPHCLPSAFQSHYHESSGYSSKEAECSSPENRADDRTHLRVPSLASKSVDIHRRRHRTPTSTMSVSNVASLTIDESSPQTNSIECTVRIKHSTHKYHLRSRLFHLIKLEWDREKQSSSSAWNEVSLSSLSLAPRSRLSTSSIDIFWPSRSHNLLRKRLASICLSISFSEGHWPR